jgi:glycosyltransferase involved in cell wall biosynthesis
MPDTFNRGELELKITVHQLLPWPYYFRALPLFLAGVYSCLKYRPVLIEAESPIISGLAAFLLSRLFRLPYLVEYRASYHNVSQFRLRFIPNRLKFQLLNYLISVTAGRADAVIANSRHYRQFLKKRGINSIVINPGLQVPNPPKHRSSHPLIIGYLGRLVPEKGVDVLISSLTLLPAEVIKNIQVEIAGDGPDRRRLSQLSHRLGLDNTISFLGFRSAAYCLNRWSILVNPNLVNHPLEMVNAEAAYFGVPVICFGRRSLPETVLHHKTGLKLVSRTPQALAQAIQTLYRNPALRRQLSRTGRSFARQNFAFSDQINRLHLLYRDIGVI